MKSFRNKQSSLLAKYSDLYAKKPKSRVFAPLSETYRKLGMYEEAFKILRKGIKIHPSYTLGYIVLANCYFDKGHLEQAYNVLRPHVESNLENLSLQKLFAKICEELGFLEEALQTFKYILLLNPSDKDVAHKVKILEEDLSYNSEETLRQKPLPSVLKSNTDFDDDDDWVQVNFNTPTKTISEETSSSTLASEDEVGNWSMGDFSENKTEEVLKKFKETLKVEDDEISEKSLDDEYYFEEYDNFNEEVVDAEGQGSESPIITHTLVDLFLKQGHKERAIEILQNILELHPEDKASRRRLSEIGNEQPPIEQESSNDHEELLNLVDQKRKKEDKLLGQVENKLQDFLNMLKVTANENCGKMNE